MKAGKKWVKTLWSLLKARGFSPYILPYQLIFWALLQVLSSLVIMSRVKSDGSKLCKLERNWVAVFNFKNYCYHLNQKQCSSVASGSWRPCWETSCPQYLLLIASPAPLLCSVDACHSGSPALCVIRLCASFGSILPLTIDLIVLVGHPLFGWLRNWI